MRNLLKTIITAMALTATCSSVSAQTQTLRYSVSATPTDTRSVCMNSSFAPAIAEFATFEPHYNSTLFKLGTDLEAMMRGNLDMSMISAQDLATLIPSWSIFTAGYVLRDGDHQRKVFASDIGKEMYGLVAEKLGVEVLQVTYFGKRNINIKGDRKIETPKDMAGIKLRMPGSESWQFLGTALGASPVPMAFTEVYTALQTGAVDGQDNPLPTVQDSKFYEVTDQIVLTGHLADMNFIAINKKLFDALPEKNQEALRNAAAKTADCIITKQEKLEAELADFFRGKGLKVYKPDLNAFRDVVQGEYIKSKFAKDWPEGMLDRINAVK